MPLYNNHKKFKEYEKLHLEAMGLKIWFIHLVKSVTLLFNVYIPYLAFGAVRLSHIPTTEVVCFWPVHIPEGYSKQL